VKWLINHEDRLVLASAEGEASMYSGFSDVIVDEAGDGKAVDFGVLRKPYRKADLARAMRAALAVAGA